MTDQAQMQIPKSTRQLNAFVTVFDLDGCISDDSGRLHLIKPGANKPEDFAAYHAECLNDKPLDVGAAFLNTHIRDGDFIIFATGRPFNYAEQTGQWITKHFGIQPFADFTIVMRRPEDSRPAVELKSEFVSFIARFAMEAKKQVKIAYDDRQDVVAMYEASGMVARVLDGDGCREHGAPSPAVAEDIATVEAIMKEDRAQARTDYGDVAGTLRDMASTFAATNEVYGNSGIKVGQIMAILFPNGITIQHEADFRVMAHFERVVAKLVRFVNSGMTHHDSVYDLSVYAAMIAAELKKD